MTRHSGGPAIGSRLAHFEITGFLGEGAMGEVYRATDRRLGREVAVKILPPAFGADAERLERFRREARLQAALTHRGIAALYEVGERDGVHFLVLELVEGETLAQRLARGALPPDEAVAIAIQIAEALEAAHQRGIVHRDLKPANVKIGPGGEAKVLDFGLATPRPGAAGADATGSPTLTAGATAAGLPIGTVAYMSPEQARGEPPDPRADVWAWGAVLFEMLTGERWIAEASGAEALAAVLRGEPDWARLPPSVPRAARRALSRTLVRDPRLRLHSIADARLELTRPEEAEGPSPLAPPAARSWARAALALAVVATAALAVWRLGGPAVEVPLRISQLAGGEDLFAPVLSPDGEKLALVRGGRLLVRHLGEHDEREIPGVRDVWVRKPFWSPDSRRIGYTTHDGIYTVSWREGPPLRVCDIPAGPVSAGAVQGAAWLDDESLVFSLDRRGLWRVPARGGEPELYAAPEASEGVALHFPAPLPDGRTLVAGAWAGREGPSDTLVFLRDGERHVARFPGWDLRQPLVSPTGHLLFLRAGTDAGIWAAPFSISRLRVTGEPVRLASDRVFAHSLGAGEALVYVSGGERVARRLVTVDRTGAIVEVHHDLALEDLRDPAPSPDGGRIALQGVVVFDGRRTIPIGREFGRSPAWSPGGGELLFVDGAGALLRAGADGGRQPVKILEGDLSTPHWSPDGRHVALRLGRAVEGAVPPREAALGRTRTYDLALLDLAAGATLAPLVASPANETDPRVSPDGRTLAYASDESGRFEIYVRPFPAGDERWQVSAGGGRLPSWAPDGTELYYVSGPHLIAVRFAAGSPPEIGAPATLFSTIERELILAEYGQSFYAPLSRERFLAVATVDRGASRATLIQGWTNLLQIE